MRLPFRLQYWTFFLIIVLIFVKLVAHILLSKKESKYTGLIWIIVVNIALLVFAFFHFYLPFRGFFYDERLKKFYFISVFLLIGFMVGNSLFQVDPFDGLGRLITYVSQENEDFLTFLLIIEFICSIIIFVCCFVGLIAYCAVIKRFDTH